MNSIETALMDLEIFERRLQLLVNNFVHHSVQKGELQPSNS